MTRTPTGNPPGRPRAQAPRTQFRFPPLLLDMIREAARLYGWTVEKWVENTLSHEAMRVRIASSLIPHGIHPKSKVYRVIDAPVQGAWTYREYMETTGVERIWVTQFIDDAPETIIPGGKAVVIDVLGGARNLMTAYQNVRWIGADPLTHHLFAKEGAEDEKKEATA